MNSFSLEGTSVKNGARRTARFLGRLELGVLVALVVFLTGFSLLQIILRNFFATGIVWGDTLARHMVLWTSLLGAARATAEGRHIRIDLLPRLLSSRGALATAVISDLFSFVVCAVLVYAAWGFVVNERMAGMVAFADIPLWWLEAIFPFSFAVMAVRFGCRLADDLAGERQGSEGGRP